MFYPVYKYAVWSGTAFALAFWIGTGSWGGAELAILVLLAAPLHAPIIYRPLRRRWLRCRRAGLGLPDAADTEILAFLTEALDSAEIDWEWRPRRSDPATWTEFVIGEGETAIFIVVENGVVEIQAFSEDPELFLDAIDSLQYIMKLLGIDDPIGKEVPFDDDVATALN
ncbi:MAG: hypothetical protein ACKVKG_17935 [Alphaproteobacteria bacterium]